MYIPVEGLVIDLGAHGLLNGPSDAMCLPAYYGEAVHTDRMSCGLAVLVDWRGSEVFFEPIPKGPSQFPDILLLTFCLGAFVPANYPSVLNSRITNSLQMVLLPFKLTCIPRLLQVLLNLLLRPLE